MAEEPSVEPSSIQIHSHSANVCALIESRQRQRYGSVLYIGRIMLMAAESCWGGGSSKHIHILLQHTRQKPRVVFRVAIIVRGRRCNQYRSVCNQGSGGVLGRERTQAQAVACALSEALFQSQTCGLLAAWNEATSLPPPPSLPALGLAAKRKAAKFRVAS